MSQQKKQIIKIIHDYFAQTNVQRVSLFGSFARDEATPESDIDLLLEVDEPIGYLKIIGYKHALEDTIHRKIDILTPAGISPKIKPHLTKDMTVIYENTR